MLNSILCLCVCLLPQAVPFDYYSQVAQWGAFTDHTSWPGQHKSNSPRSSGKSYSYRADWSGQPSDLPPAAQHSVQSNRPTETGFGDSAREFIPTTYQTSPAEQISPQTYFSQQQLYNRPIEFNINPQSAPRVPHRSLKNSAIEYNARTQIPLQVPNQPFNLRSNWPRPTNVYTTQTYQNSFISPSTNWFSRHVEQLPNNLKPPQSHRVNWLQQNNIKLRTTQESYFGNDNIAEQSELGEQRVRVQPLGPQAIWPQGTTRKHGNPSNRRLEQQINWPQSNVIVPQAQGESFADSSKWLGLINYDLLSSINSQIGPQTRFAEKAKSEAPIYHGETFQHSTNPPKRPILNVTPPNLNPTVFGNLFEQDNSDTSDFDQTYLYKSTSPLNGFGSPNTKLSPHVVKPNWPDHTNPTPSSLLEEQVHITKELNNISPNEHIQFTYISPTGPNSTTGIPLLEPFRHVDDTRLNEHEENAVLIQPSEQWETCEGPGGLTGHCVPVDHCDLDGSIGYQHYQTQQYYCILKQKRERTRSIGICCVNHKPDPPVDHVDADSLGIQDVGETDNPDEDFHEHPEHDVHDHHHHFHEHCVYPIADYKICGRNGKMMSNITTGATASVKDWPWMAVLVFSSSLEQFCGGTVITRRHVLTAAHCFRTIDPNETLVLLGDHDVKQSNESRSRAFTVAQLISNDDYDPATHENDIALLVLNTTTVYNNYIQPACLPAPGPRYTNETAAITGWGAIQYKGQLPTDLNEVTLPVWEQDICIPKFAQTIFNTSMCAGAFEGGKDSCQGDSGGPLVMQCHHSHRWVVIGIVSWGIRCGERDKPGIYTRVNEYLEWINENIADNSTDVTHPHIT